jgi:hypothetical protein
MSSIIKKITKSKGRNTIPKVPPELLDDIMFRALQAHLSECSRSEYEGAFPSLSTPPMAFLLVSREWHEIALGTPALWRHLCLDHPKGGAVMRSARREGKALKMYTRLSGEMGMQLTIVRKVLPKFTSGQAQNEPNHDPRDNDLRLGLGPELKEALLRCVSVDVAGNSRLLNRVLDGLEHSERLKRLVLRTVDGGFDGGFNVPVIRQIIIEREFLSGLNELRVFAAASGYRTSQPVVVGFEEPVRPCALLRSLQLQHILPLSPGQVVQTIGMANNLVTAEVSMGLQPPHISSTIPNVSFPNNGRLRMLRSLTINLTISLADGMYGINRVLPQVQQYASVTLPVLEALTLNLCMRRGVPPNRIGVDEEALLTYHYNRPNPALFIIFNTLLRESQNVRRMIIKGLDATTSTDVTRFLANFPKVEELTIAGRSHRLIAVLGFLGEHVCNTERRSVVLPRMRALTVRGFTWEEADQTAIRNMVVSRWCRDCREKQESAEVTVRSLRTVKISPPRSRTTHPLKGMGDQEFLRLKKKELEVIEFDEGDVL